MKLEVGRIDKAHGLRGEVVVSLVTDRLERVAVGARLEHDGGVLTVEVSRPHQHRFIVKFEEVADRNAADAFRGTVLYGDPIDDPDVLWVHELVGRPVADLCGTVLGQVTGVEQNPASDLLVLDSGALIPLTFFVARHEDGTIEVDPPVGLLDPGEAVDARPGPGEGDGPGESSASNDGEPG